MPHAPCRTRSTAFAATQNRLQQRHECLQPTRSAHSSRRHARSIASEPSPPPQTGWTGVRVAYGHSGLGAAPAGACRGASPAGYAAAAAVHESGNSDAVMRPAPPGIHPTLHRSLNRSCFNRMRLLILLLAAAAGCAAQAPAPVPAAAPAPPPAPAPAEALPAPESLTALQLTTQLVANFTAAYGPGERLAPVPGGAHAACRSVPSA